jgi:cell fate regulator YaaT (PSP1 superfamily)
MYVLADTSRGIEYSEAVTDVREVEDSEIVAPLREIVRIATDEDKKTFEENKQKEKEAFKVCQEKIRSHGLDMKLIDVEYTFDGSKVLLYFTSENRIDFRDLVKELASVFRTRIELRQIGVRDEAKTVGGLGICGRVLCCNSAFGDFQPVSIKMAKEQGLSLNPTKISGTCGRLMCCLKYEQEAYEDAIRRVPGIGTLVETPEGRGVVETNDLLRETVQVRLDRDGENGELVKFKAEEVEVLKKKKHHNNNHQAEEEQQD